MKLKEKFLDLVYPFLGSGMLTNTIDEDIIEINSTKCEKIADEHSLSFVNWLMDNCELSEDNSLWSYESEDYTNEKLLEIFKNK